jgi:LacI family transcriptional regulator
MTDMSAIGAIRALKDAGVKVPEQVAVIGHGNLDEGTYLSPSLSTIDQHPQRMGAQAIDLLIESIQGNQLGGNRLLDPDLVVRESTAFPSQE